MLHNTKKVLKSSIVHKDFWIKNILSIYIWNAHYKYICKCGVQLPSVRIDGGKYIYSLMLTVLLWYDISGKYFHFTYFIEINIFI